MTTTKPSKPWRWGDVAEPNRDCPYTHVSLLYRSKDLNTEKDVCAARIEWKGWKDYDSYAVSIDPTALFVLSEVSPQLVFGVGAGFDSGAVYIGSADTLDDAKALCEKALAQFGLWAAKAFAGDPQ